MRTPKKWKFPTSKQATIDARVSDILKLRHVTRGTRTGAGFALSLPPVYPYKYQVRGGDTIYLGCNDNVRAFTLPSSALGGHEEKLPLPVRALCAALLGKHQGDRVRIATPHGSADYTIVKIL